MRKKRIPSTMYNFKVDVTGETWEEFSVTMGLLANVAHIVNGYKVAENVLILFWATGETCVKQGAQVFPYSMDLTQTATFAWGWLNSVSPTTIRPEIDGHVGRGWCIKTPNNSSRPQERNPYALAHISPVWALYPK